MWKESLVCNSPGLGNSLGGLVDSACGKLKFHRKIFEEIQIVILISALTFSSHKDNIDLVQ